jgi:hypothetical protein
VEPFASFARGVAQVPPSEDEESLPAMGRADFSRREQSRRKPVAKADQVSGDLGKTEPQMMGDVLQKDEIGLDFADDAGDMRPEVALVGLAASLAGDREGLAGIAGSEAMNAVTPRAAVEGSQIRP